MSGAAVGGVQVRTLPLDSWYDEVAACKIEGYDFFDWLSAVDRTGAVGDGTYADVQAPEDTDAGGEQAPGMLLVLHLIATSKPDGDGSLSRVLLHTLVPVGASVPSVTSVFAGAAWHERETHEMFGVDFTGFEDGTGQGLRPLLLPEGFEGTPLAKSFVLAARASKPWPGAKEPGESDADRSSSPDGGAADAPARRPRKRRKILPPGVPDPSWGPR